MAYSNILIISDNLFLSKKILPILREKLSRNQTLSFSTSPFSNSFIFCNELNIEVNNYNLKDNFEIDVLKSKFDLIISIHCKQIFPKDLVNNVKCINVHPGYNPINRGWYPQVFAIINQVPVGATIHEIDEELDNGAIIDQDFVNYDLADTSFTLYNKILEKEVELFQKNIESILLNTYITKPIVDKGKLYLKKDFMDLCEINLNEKATYGEVINRLRALSHGNYKNAFFKDSVTNEKFFLSLSIDKIM